MRRQRGEKGIIHRDLKPSNVLVTLHDGRPVPKVIDFGVAKATNQQLTEKTLFTNLTQMIGTPLYMSPEQAEMSGLDVDTRSDIYSLGVLLYELLTGTTPFDKAASAKSLTTSCGTSSARSSRSGRAHSLTLSGRRTDGRGAAGRCRALCPAAARRSGLGRDEGAGKRSHSPLSDRFWPGARCRAIHSRRACGGAFAVGRVSLPKIRSPQSRGDRHRGDCLRGLLCGTTVSTWQAIRALYAERMAEAALAIAETERNEAESQRARAEASFQAARRVIDERSTSVVDDELLSMPALEPLRRERLESTLGYYKQFIDLYRNDPNVEGQLAEAFRRVGEIARATGDTREAAEAFQEASRRYDALFCDQPTVVAHSWGLAGTLCELGLLQNELARPADAEASNGRALDLLAKLGGEHPGNADYQLATARPIQVSASPTIHSAARPTPPERCDAPSISTTSLPVSSATSPRRESTGLTSPARNINWASPSARPAGWLTPRRLSGPPAKSMSD